MPNWCECDLIVHAECDSDDEESRKEAEKKLREFKEFAYSANEYGNREQVLSSKKFVPYPPEQKIIDEEYDYRTKLFKLMSKEEGSKSISEHGYPKDWFNQGGYEWCCENWGSKWGICDSELIEEDYRYGSLIYAFQSPWTPPCGIINAMGRKFPDLTFCVTYFERGAAFNGIFEVKGDEVLKDESAKYWGTRGG